MSRVLQLNTDMGESEVEKRIEKVYESVFDPDLDTLKHDDWP